MAQPQPASAGDFSMSNGPPRPPPQANLDPDRTYARDQPPNLREAFTSFYPNGLPNFYKMLQTPGPEGVVQTYVEDYLPVGFYSNPPVDARAVFSTSNGSNPFRFMEHLLPQRRVHLWSSDEVQSACNSLRKLYWEVIKDMPHPYCWDSLWDYFDAQDIYNYGALNLWNVVSQLFLENQSIALDVHNAFSIEVGQWVDCWLYDDENRDKLMKSNETGLSINGVISWEAMKGLPDDAIHLIASALEHRRSLLLSPEKLRPGAMKPNHFKEFYEKGHLENWLAGQRILGPSGLSTRPTEWQPHHSSPASEKVTHPLVVLDGKHYFRLPECRVPSAVEALQQSAAAAGPAPHINSETTSIEQTKTNDTTAYGGLRVKTQARSKSTEPFPSVRTPSPYTNGKDNDEEATSFSNGHHEQEEQEDFDEMTPTRVKRHGRKNPRATRGARKSTVTTSLPGSAVMGNSSLASPAKDVANVKQAQATSSRSKDQITGSISRSAELRSRANDRPKNQRPNRAFDESVAHDQKAMKYPGVMSTFNQMKRPDVFFQNSAMNTELSEDMKLSGQSAMQTPSGATFYSSGTFNPATQGNYSLPPQQNFPTQNGFDYGFPQFQQSQPPQRGPLTGRGRNTSTSSRNDRFDLNDGRWSHQNHENTNGGNAGSSRGGFHRGAGRKGRRGGHNQRNTTAPVSQPHTGPDFNQKRREGTPWNDSWRRDQVTCQNVQDGLAIKDYVPCCCPLCDSRDRSVYIIVQGYQGINGPDILARLKFGLAERYGHVDEVFPIASKEPGRYIARFVKSSSVGEALAIGGGNMPEQGISVTFSPALRSKWTLSEQAPTRPVPGRNSGQNSAALPFSPYPFGLSMPGNTPSTAAVPRIMPGIIHPAVVNPGQAHDSRFWQPNGGQRSVSGFVQPSASVIPSTIVQSGPGIQALLPGPPTLAPKQIVLPPTQQAQENTSSPEVLQTKPPSEEALDEIYHPDQDDPGSPRSDGSNNTGIKARVSLPSTPSKASLASQGAPTKPNEAAEGLAGTDTTTHQQNGMPMKGLESRAETKMTTSGHQFELPCEPTGSNNSHSRAPSGFSKNEIKERQRAWAKIPMPLALRGPRSATPMKPIEHGSNSGSNSGGGKSDNRDPNATKLGLSVSGQNVTSAPNTSDVYEPPTPKNPESTFPLPQAPKSSPAAHSTRSTKQDATESQGTTLDEAQPPEMPATSPMTENVTSKVEQSFEQEHTSDTLPRGKGKNAKKAKKKNAKNVASTNSESNHTFQQNEPSSSPQSSYTAPQYMHGSSGGLGSNAHYGGHIGSQESGSSSPIKRHHDDPEQPSVSGSAKRSKKHGNKHDASQPQSQPSFDESDSPDEDERGRRGFRMGRGGSLRFGKQRRPRPITASSMLAGEQFDTQAPPPSSDFAFQCQSLPEHADSLNLGDHGNGARSRLNPEAREFVSPSRTASVTKRPIVTLTDGKASSSGTVNESAVKYDQADEPIREAPKAGHGDACETPLQNEKAPSAVTSQTPQRRRAISEAAQKGTPRKEKGPSHQGEGKKTPAKSLKRGKGKERVVTVSAKADKAEAKVEKAQEMPQTPENQGGNVKKPGLIDDDWPSLPASRERAQSKPQTPLIWGGKTKSTQDDGGLGQGSPITKN